MNITDELYQQTILEYNRNPRNFYKMENPTYSAHGLNPLCGDDYWVYLRVDEDGVISEASFDGHGCAVSKASASLMTQALIGEEISRAQELFGEFHEMATGATEGKCDICSLGKLCVFSGVWKYAERVKCAVLAWRAMESALSGEKTVSTE